MMPFRTVNNVSILPKHLPSKEDPRHPVHYIHKASAPSQDICDMNTALGDCIFRDLLFNNTSTYNFNEAEFELGRVAVFSHLI